jgi:hypothetical protein
MPRAVLKNGIICPVEPLPADWAEGQELWVEAAREGKPEPIDDWYRELEEAVAAIDPEDERRFHEAISEVRRQAKEQARREMGLPCWPVTCWTQTT